MARGAVAGRMVPEGVLRESSEGWCALPGPTPVRPDVGALYPERPVSFALPPVPPRKPDGSLDWSRIIEGAKVILAPPGTIDRARSLRYAAWLAACGTTPEALVAELDRAFGPLQPVRP